MMPVSSCRSPRHPVTRVHTDTVQYAYLAVGIGVIDYPAGAGGDVLPQLWHPCVGRAHDESGSREYRQSG